MKLDPSPNPERAEEHEWLARIRTGDSTCFEAMFRRYHAPLCAYVEGYVGSPEVAKEVVSDTFLWLWQRRARLEITSSLKSYLYAAARNGALNYLRHERTAQRTQDDAAFGGYAPGMGELPGRPEEALEASELATTVEHAIAALPDRAREAFLLWREHELSHAEIGSVMGISPRTVEKHLARAVGDLRDAIAARHG